MGCSNRIREAAWSAFGGLIVAGLLLWLPAPVEARFDSGAEATNATAALFEPLKRQSRRAQRRARRWARRDSDRDGLPNRTEVRRTRTNPRRRDTDRDRLIDGVEVKRTRTNPRRRDTDRDRLTDWFELRRSKTNPRRADTDGDGARDGWELAAGTNPRNPASVPWLVPAPPIPVPVPAPVIPPPPEPEDDEEEPPNPPPSDTTPPPIKVDSGPDGLTNDPSPTFTFSSEPGATFQCSIDEGTPDLGPCSGSESHGPAEPLGDGPHTFRVRAFDAAGNQATATRAFEVDATVPETTVDTAPGALVNSAAAIFEFSGSDPGGSGIASFQCKLDGGGFSACASGIELTELTEGAHNFEVRAIDNAGNADESPASHEWQVDTTSPALSIDSGPEGLTNNATPTFGFSSPDPEPGSGVASVVCSIDQGEADFGACSGAESHDPESPLADGEYTFRVRATDEAGNQATATRDFEVDATAPDTQVDKAPAVLANSDVATFEFSGSDPEGSGVASFQCRLDSEGPEAWASCSTPQQYEGLADGAHGFEVRALDNAGNIDQSPVSHEWEIDTTPPWVSISSGPDGLTNNPSPTFGFSSEPGATFQCSIDQGTPVFGPCSGSGSHGPAEPLGDGEYTFRVRATDAAGNQAMATRGFEVDTAAPGAPELESTEPPSPANENKPLVIGSAPAGTTVRLYVGGDCDGAEIATVTPAELEVGVEASVGDDSTTAFRATATTAAENTSGCSEALIYVEDSNNPETEIDAAPAALVNSDEATFEFSGSDPEGSGVATFQCQLDGGGFSACSSSLLLTALSAGNHKFEVRAVDNAGNIDAEPASHEWTIDLTPPAVSIDSGPEGLTNNASPTFGFSSEPGATFQCSIDNGTPDFGSCSGSESHDPAEPLDDGPHTFRVRASDAAGNQATATRAFEVDATVPETTVDTAPGALVNSAAAIFEFSGSDPGGSGVASFQCRLDSEDKEDWANCTSPLELAELADGGHTFEIKAVDNAGNVDQSPASHEWEIDTTPPALSIDSGPDGLTNDPSPTFAFSSEPGAGFACSIDQGAPDFGPCSGAESHGPAGPLADGAHTFRVRATDEAGNQAVATRDFDLDATAPETQIDIAPAALINSDEATFEFSGSDPEGSGIASFQCRLDSEGSEAWVTCSSPQQHEGLADGGHGFEVRALDNAGNVDQSPASHEWTVDLTAPGISVDSGPTDLTNNPSPTFEFSSEPGATFQCSIDNGTPDFGSCSGSEFHGPAEPLGDGPHTFRVRASDAAGNQTTATRGFEVDATAPTTQIDSGPATLTNDADAALAFSGGDGGGSGIASFQCRLDSEDEEDWAGCISPVELAELADGAHAFEVRAIDSAGNADGSPAFHEWTVDLSPPVVSIDSGPEGLTNNASPTFGFSSEPGATPQCSIDTGTPDFGPCSGSESHGPAEPLGDGPHAFRVRATDAAGNQATETRTFEVDATAPETTIGSGPAALTNSADAKIEFLGSDPGGSGVASFQCQLDGGGFSDCSSGIELGGLSEGAHTFEVKATDNAGNVDGSPASHEWTIDLTPPAVSVDSGPEGLTNDPSATFTFSSEPGATFQCSIDQGEADFGPCSGPESHGPAEPLGDGAHTFRVRATDEAGNQAVGARGFELDATAPDTQIDKAPAVLANSAKATFEFSGSDPKGSGVASFQCSVNEAPFSACASGVELTDLADGTHVFEVRAIDSAGNVDQNPAIHEWEVDTAPPPLSVDSGPDGLTNNPSPTFAFSSEPSAAFQCSIDEGEAAFGPCSGAESHSPAEPLGDGPHTFRVRASDVAGNQATATRDFEVDTAAPTAPELESTEPASPASENNPLVLGSAEAETTVRLYAGGDCEGVPMATVGAAALEAGIEVSVADDSTTAFRATATTPAENTSGCSEALIYVEDSTNPQTQIDKAPAVLVNSDAATFEFSGSDPGGSGVASFQCKLDEGSFEACSSSLLLTALSAGNHKLEVRAVDNAGNIDAEPASHEWEIDTTPPPLSIDSGPTGLTNNPSPTFGFSSEAGATFQCSIDQGTPAFGPCSGSGSHGPAEPLGDGEYTFRVRATDEAGNEAIATRDFDVDTAAPQAPQLESTEPPSPANENKPLVIGSAPAGTTVRLYTGSDCEGAEIATVTPAKLESGVEATVADDSTTAFRATATTAAENTSGCSEALVYVEDSTDPQTQIDTAPAALTNDADAEFAFSGSDPEGSGVASFQCKLDAGSFETCSSSLLLTALSAGNRKFEVRAVDNAGNIDAEPASHEWTIDLAPPAVSVDSGPAGLTNNPTPTFEFSSEPGATFQCSIDQGEADFGPCSDAGSHTPEEPLADGEYTFRVRATDEAGNQATATRDFDLDATAPETQIDIAPAALVNSDEASFEFSGSDPEGSGVAFFQCRLDSEGPEAWATCSSPQQYKGLADGDHGFEVRAIDQAGNIDQSPASHEWEIDTTPPSVSVDSGPDGLTNNPSPTFAFSSEPGAGFACSIDQGTPDFGPCSGAESHSPAEPLGDGPHTFRVRASDVAGNQATATRDFEVDTAAPTAPELESTEPASPANENNPLVLGSAEAETTVRLYTGGNCEEVPVATVGAAALEAGVEVSVADDSTTAFRATATTPAENTSGCSEALIYVEDSTNPQTQIDTAPAALTNDADAEFAFSGSDPGGSGVASFQCKLDEGSFEACSSSLLLTALSAGNHKLEVRAVDNAGNIDAEPASHEWEIDLIPPAVSVDSGPTGLTNNPSPTFEFSSEPGASFECSIDQGEADFGPCSGTGEHTPESPLADGEYTFRVRATDEAGNQATATRDFEIDTAVPPAPELTATEPAWPANENNPLVIGSADAGTIVRLYVGGSCEELPIATVGPAELEAGIEVLVADDSVTIFRATATTAAENTSGCSAWLPYIEDSTDPETQIDSGPAALVSSDKAVLEFSGSDPGFFGIASYQCRLDSEGSQAWATCSSPRQYEGLADGAHSFEVRAIDQAGNVDQSPATRGWSIETDTGRPETQIDANPDAFTQSHAATFAFSGSDPGGSGVALFECRLDSESWISCTSPQEYAALSEGPHEFEVRAVDNAGNPDLIPASFNWTIDNTPPKTQIDSGPDGLTSNPSPTFGFSSEPGATFECSLDEGEADFGACSETGAHTPAEPLADGPHTFRVRATDPAGNQATATRGFEVDSTAPPEPTLSETTPASPANENAPKLFGSALPGSVVHLYTGGACSGSPVATLSPAELEAGIAFPVPDDSTTVFRADIETAERTSGCSEPLTYVEDSSPPETTIASSPPAATYSTSASFFMTVDEQAASKECSLDGSAFGACESPRSYADLALGEHSFSVRATDAAGNLESAPAEWSWTIESPPVPASACGGGGVEATTAPAVRAAVEASESVCVTAAVGDVDLGDLGSRPVVVSTAAAGSIGDVDLGSTTDLTIGQARLQTVELRHSHRTHLLDNTIGGSEAEPALDQAIFMPDDNDDVLIEGNDIGWMIADETGNTGYGCRCYGDLDRLRFVGNRLHDLGADGFQGVGGVDVLIDRNEIGPVGRNPGSDEHSDNIQITGNEANLRITNNWIHHQGYYAGAVTANAGSTYIHGGSTGSLTFENNLIETAQGRTEICGLGSGGHERSNLTIRRNTWVEGGLAFNGFPGFEWDCDAGTGNTITRNVAIDPDGGFANHGYPGAVVEPNLFGEPSLVTLDAAGNCTSANCNPPGEDPIGYRKPSGVVW